MFHFLHGFMPETPYWQGLVRQGLIDDSAGVKLMHHPDLSAEASFNQAAKTTGPLYEIIREANRPFYVDRLQGGLFYGYYPFDTGLIRQYEALLGENFLGFQLHEWASNFTQDLARISAALEGHAAPWTEQGITQALRQAYPYTHLYLESQDAGEFAQIKPPKSIPALLALLEGLFQKRLHTAGGHLLPADSSFIGARAELAWGARQLMPEVGCQIGGTRVQLALARGLTRAAGTSFGAYYEPWGGAPFSTCYYKTDLANEWGIGADGDFPFQPAGPNGGSSRALQRRIFFYAYLSGAAFVSEEWGICNTFYDWEDFALTPYGEVKKEFLSFTREHPAAGNPYTPFCLVLPKSLPFFDLNWLYGKTDQYLGLPAETLSPYIRQIAALCRLLFGDPTPRGGEEHALTNSAFGDLFDFVYEDTPGIFDRYAYAVDLTGSPEFCRTNAPWARQILPGGDLQALASALEGLCKKLLPFQIEAAPHWLCSRVESGVWILSFFNNSGVSRSVEKGELLDEGARASLCISVPAGSTAQALYGCGWHLENHRLTATLAPGDVSVLRLSIPSTC